MSIITTIKNNFRNSESFKEGIEVCKAAQADRYRVLGEALEAFLVLDNYDDQISQSILRLINHKEETEIHNVIAGLSYEMPLFGSSIHVLYEADFVKISLAATIMWEYSKHYGYREEQIIKRYNGRAYSIEHKYISATSVDELEKNKLEGIHFEKGMYTQKFIKTKPGAPRLRPSKYQKRVGKAAGSMAFRVCKDVNKEIIMEALLTGKDYIAALAGNTSEHRLAMKARFESEVELFEMIQKRSWLSPIYYSISFEYRGRFKYDVALQILNPQGKIGRYVLESNRERRLGEKDYHELCFVALSTMRRCQHDTAVIEFEANEREVIANLLDESDVLKLIYNKRIVKAIADYREGNKSRFLLAKDYTTGGLIHFSTGYTQEMKSLKLANVVKGADLYDSHSEVMDKAIAVTGLDIVRDDAKIINQAIIAGVTAKSASNKFNEHFGDEVMKAEDIATIGKDVYGTTYEVFNKFNNWGNNLIDNDNTSLLWTNRFGTKCLSSAYIKGQEVKVHFPTTDDGANKSMTIHRNMPYYMENTTGRPLVLGEYAKVKASGFFANSTHSVDNEPITEMILRLHEEDEVGLFIHDNILAFGINHAEIVLPTAVECIEYNYEHRPFYQIQEQVAKNRKGTFIKPMDYGQLAKDTDVLEVSNNFLQA